MTSFISHIASYAAFFGLLDVMLSRSVREKVSWYIFGFQGTDFPKMEKALISGLVQFVLPPSFLISLLRLWLVSFSLLLALYIGFSVFVAVDLDLVEVWQSGLLATLIYLMKVLLFCATFGFFSVPIDAISARVTRYIFVRKQRPIATYPIWIAIDMMLSSFVWFAIFVLFLFGVIVLGFEFEAEKLKRIEDFFSIHGAFALFSMGMLFSTSSIIFLSTVQVLALILGTSLRALSSLLHLNQWLAMRSEVHRFPFTFMGIVVGALTALVVGVEA